MSDLQPGLYDPEVSNVAKETGGTLADIKNGVTPSDTAGDGTLTVAAAGTAVQFPDIACKRAYIQAHEDNTGRIVVGGSTVVAAKAGRRGRAFYKTHGDWFNVSNLNLLFADATANTQKVNYYYEN